MHEGNSNHVNIQSVGDYTLGWDMLEMVGPLDSYTIVPLTADVAMDFAWEMGRTSVPSVDHE